MALENAASQDITKMVKNAIKAKLQEIGVYADKELPEYIMILVGNKKTKDQMDDDLSLFLGNNTEKFTSWLHGVLQRLNDANIFQNLKTSKEKEKKIDDTEVESDFKEPPPIIEKVPEEKKKHKKKKDKSEKKKEKKEKKKKKDKDKDKEKHSKSQKVKKDKSKSKSPLLKIDEQNIIESCADGVSELAKASSAVVIDDDDDDDTKPVTIQEDEVSCAKLEPEVLTKDDELEEDVVDLRPDADEIAMGLEDDELVKKQKSKFGKEFTNDDSLLEVSEVGTSIQNIKVKVDFVETDDPTADEDDQSEQEVTTSGVHERLGPPMNHASTKRIINLREESSFPPRSQSGSLSSTISSAVKSVSVPSSKKTGKKLEARVRPLPSSRPCKDDVDETSPRIVSTVGAVLKRSHSNDDSEDSEEPSSKRLAGIASKIEVMPRPRRVGALQANKALILRAVADAHKSVNKPSRKAIDAKDDDDQDHERPVKKAIFSRSYQERQSQRLAKGSEAEATQRVRKLAVTVPNALLKAPVDAVKADESFLGDLAMEEDEEEEAPKSRPVTQKMPDAKPKPSSKVMPMQVDEGSASTRFFVTLDGIGNEASGGNLRTRLAGRPVTTTSSSTPSIDEEEFIEEIEEWEEEVEDMEVSSQGGAGGGERGGDFVSTSAASHKWKAKTDFAATLFPKKEERCRYWPACKEGTACQYIHPSKICNMFPSCKFGDKCIYIHPKCKFDGACLKPSCPFTHTVPRTTTYAPAPFVAPVKGKPLSGKAMIKCRYYPKCVDMNCPYMHPKQICRYGKSCQTPSCLFVHPEVTTGALLKWTAPKTGAATTESSEVDVQSLETTKPKISVKAT